MKPKVTIIMPTYNRAIYLGDSIKSVLSQTHENLKVIILDNCSTDKTVAVVNSFNDKRLSYKRTQENIHMMDNWNKGIELALDSDCDYFMLFHDDDLMKPEMVAKQVEVMKSDTKIVTVACQADILDGEGKLDNNSKYNNCLNPQDRMFNQYEYITYTYNEDDSGAGMRIMSFMYRTSFFKNTPIRFRSKVGLTADSYFKFELNSIPHIKMYLIADKLLQVRKHGQRYSPIEMRLPFQLFARKLMLKEKQNDIISILDRKINTSIHVVLRYCAFKDNPKETLRSLDKYHDDLKKILTKHNYLCMRITMNSPLMYNHLYSLYKCSIRPLKILFKKKR